MFAFSAAPARDSMPPTDRAIGAALATEYDCQRPRRHRRERTEVLVEGANPDLKVPFAFEGERPVLPREACRNGDYVCPICRQAVVLRAGEIKVRHFAHVSVETGGLCALESDEHVRAKAVLFGMLLEWLKSNNHPRYRPKLLNLCAACGHVNWDELPVWAAQVRWEAPVMAPGGGRRIADVALQSADGQKTLAFEVRQAHGVDATKARALRGVAWMELEAEDVVAHPLRLVPLTCDNLTLAPCAACGFQAATPYDLLAQATAYLDVADQAEAKNREWGREVRGLFEAVAAYQRAQRTLDLIFRYASHPMFRGPIIRVKTKLAEWLARLDRWLDRPPRNELSDDELRDTALRLRRAPEVPPPVARPQQLDLWR